MKRDLLFIALSLFTWGFGEGMFFYFQPLYLQQLGADPIVIGSILGGYSAAMAVAHIPAGYLSDRLGRRQFLWAAWSLGWLATILMAAASSLPVFIAGLLAYGMTSFVISPLNSYVTAARGNWSVGRAITLISGSFNLGMVFGPLFGGWIAETWGMRNIFIVAVIIFTISNIPILFIRRQPVEANPAESKGLSFIRQRQFLVYMAVVFLAVFATYLALPLSQNYLYDQRGVSLSEIGRLTALTGLGVVALNLGLGHFSERYGFLAAQAAVGGFTLLIWQGHSLPWYALGYFLMGGYKTTRSLAAAQVRSLIHSARMGLAYGVTEFVGSLAGILAPVLAGILYSSNPDWIYSISAVLITISIITGALMTLRARSLPSQHIFAKE